MLLEYLVFLAIPNNIGSKNPSSVVLDVGKEMFVNVLLG